MDEVYRRTADSGRQAADSSEQTAGSGQRSAVSGQQSAVSGQQTAGSGQRSADSGRQSAVGSQRSAVGGGQSADGVQQTADSGQRSAVSRQPTTIDHRPSTTDDRRTTNDDISTTDDRRPTTNDYSLWGGRFQKAPDPRFWALNASLDVDRRLALHDLRGTRAWVRALARAGVLSPEERQVLLNALEAVEQEFRAGTFAFKPGDEDIHTAIERRLRELVGPVAGKVHTGRSRNDQVVTAFRLWMREALAHLESATRDLQQALVERAQADREVIVPGYTHLQQAQPIVLAHWWLAHFWALERDRERMGALFPRVNRLPLGAAALAGTTVPVDRQALARELGFQEPIPNAWDAVADRDFVAEFLFIATLLGIHLSRLAEGIILFTSREFGFLELDDAFATGSSLMPQKKNPDAFELARGQAGTLLGLLTGFLATLKALPSAYDKDLQEDKAPTFRAYDLLMALLPVLADALRTLHVHRERARALLADDLFATDLADYLVARGVPFREAHALVGRALLLARERGQPLHQLPLETWQALHPAFDQDVYQVFDPWRVVQRRQVEGGTAPQALERQLQQAQQALQHTRIPQAPSSL